MGTILKWLKPNAAAKVKRSDEDIRRRLEEWKSRRPVPGPDPEIDAVLAESDEEFELRMQARKKALERRRRETSMAQQEAAHRDGLDGSQGVHRMISAMIRQGDLG